MKQLFVIDLRDYGENCAVSRRPSARGIIMNGRTIALVYSKREGYYKFPGGGFKDGEDMKAALIREVREEVGLIVKPESIVGFGSALRRQKSNMQPNTIFEQENFYFFCETEDETTVQELDDYEREAEFTLRFVDIDEAIEKNRAYHSEDIFDDIMIQRETKVLELIRDMKVKK